MDKAFPLQTASGTEVINTNEDLLPVLKEVMQDISASTHVKPIIFTDKELYYITPLQIGNIGAFKDSLKVELVNKPVQTMLHDSVFVKIAEAAKLFKILVLKTNQTIPYSSVYIQLDCAYWNSEKEKTLRDSI